MQAVCDASQQEMLSYFLQCWCGLFSISATPSAAGLFCAEYAALAAAATLLLFAGPVRCGAGVHLFVYDAVRPWQRPLSRAAAGGGRREKHPRFVAAGHSGRPCRRLPVHVRCISTAGERAHPAYSFRKTVGQACSGARELMGQYLLVIVVFLPLWRSDRGRLSERKNPLTSAFLAMPPRVCYNKENG